MLINLYGHWINPSNIVKVDWDEYTPLFDNTSNEKNPTKKTLFFIFFGSWNKKIKINVKDTNQKTIEEFVDYINLLEVQASSKIFNSNEVSEVVKTKKYGVWDEKTNSLTPVIFDNKFETLNKSVVETKKWGIWSHGHQTWMKDVSNDEVKNYAYDNKEEAISELNELHMLGATNIEVREYSCYLYTGDE